MEAYEILKKFYSKLKIFECRRCGFPHQAITPPAFCADCGYGKSPRHYKKPKYVRKMLKAYKLLQKKCGIDNPHMPKAVWRMCLLEYDLEEAGYNTRGERI